MDNYRVSWRGALGACELKRIAGSSVLLGLLLSGGACASFRSTSEVPAHPVSARQSEPAAAAPTARATGPAVATDTASGSSSDEGLVSAASAQDADEAEPQVVSLRALQRHPLEDLSQAEIEDRLRDDIESLGSMSVGAPNGGRLINAVRLPDDPRWELVDPANAWGTAETVAYLRTAIAAVHARFPETPPLHIGHISRQSGGYLSPHRSHQSGRDVDLGYYYKPEAHQWYRRANKQTLDLDRTWALVRSLITETDVRLILIDISVQRVLREHAEKLGEDPQWLDDVFRGNGPQRRPLIRHEPGHATHIHVRFYNPVAQETARRCYASLVKLGRVKPPVHYIRYRARRGDTLIGMAKRYGTTVRAIQRANGLRSSTIYAKKVYKIPRRGPAAAGSRVEVPPRRLPPDYPSDARQTRHDEPLDRGPLGANLRPW